MSEISARAKAIVRALVITQQARVRDLYSGGFARLLGCEVGPGGAPHFWVAHDGSKIIRNWPDHRDEILPDAFTDDMARSGDSPAGRAVELKPGRIPTPEEDPSLYDYYDYPYRPPGWVNPIQFELPKHIQKAIAKRKSQQESDRS